MKASCISGVLSVLLILIALGFGIGTMPMVFAVFSMLSAVSIAGFEGLSSKFKSNEQKLIEERIKILTAHGDLEDTQILKSENPAKQNLLRRILNRKKELDTPEEYFYEQVNNSEQLESSTINMD